MNEIKFLLDHLDTGVLQNIGGRVGDFVRLIQTNDPVDEKALMTRLFEGKWQRQNYLNLKARTRRILRAFYLMNPVGNTSLQKRLRKCRSVYFLAVSFVDEGNRKEGEKLLKKALRIAEENGLTKIAYDCVVELMSCAAIHRRPTELRQYSVRAQALLNDLEAENTAEQHYLEVIVGTNTNNSPSYEFINERIQKLTKYQCSTTRYIQHYYMLCIARDSECCDYPRIKQSAKAALHMLRDKRGVYGSTLQFFSKHQAIAHIALREYPAATQLLTTAEQYAPPRSFNRGILYYYQAFGALHARNYEDAHQLYREHRNTPYTVLAEQWTIMGAYLYFLKRSGHLGSGGERFSVGKYLNETAPTAHDKLGNNVNIIIGELLVCLVKNRDRYIDRVDSVRNYVYKYLQVPATRRAHHFLHLLCLLPRADFNYPKLRHLGTRHLQALAEPLHPGEDLTLEVLPYLDLLPMIHRALQIKVA